MKKHLVLSARLSEELLRESPDLYLHFLPRQFRKDVLKYNRKRKQWLSFVGKLLLAQGLAIVEKKKLMEQPIQYTPKRRPFLDNTLDFNISHSNKRVICVIAPENRIGVDIQEKGDYRIEETSRFYFNDETREEIKTGTLNLVNLWCRTEAFSKAIGTGLDENIKKYSVLEASVIHEDTRWNFLKIPVDPAFECILVTDAIHPKIDFYEYRLQLEALRQANL